jgi:hypothetical protein
MKPLAVFTIAQNETRFLPAWLNCYTREVPPEDIYVLDHQTTGDAADAMIEACQVAGIENILAVQHEQSYDSFWLSLITRYFQQFLLMSYRAVLFSAVDELVLPLQGSLVDYANTITSSTTPVCKGYEVVHDKDNEPAIDWDKPLVAQRKHCYHCRAYSKALLATTPLYWGGGWFRATNVPHTQEPDPNLILLHLHRIDYDECLRFHREKSARTWKPEERREGIFRHNMVEDPEMLSRWLLCNADEQSEYAKLIEIPERFKEFA